MTMARGTTMTQATVMVHTAIVHTAMLTIMAMSIKTKALTDLTLSMGAFVG